MEEDGQLQKNDAASHMEFVAGEKLWVSLLVDFAGRITTQLATMGMSNVRYVLEPNVSPNARLTLFFEGVLGALERLRSNREASLAEEARRLCRGAMTKFLTKMAYWNHDLDFPDSLDSLPDGVDPALLEERIEPVISCIDGVRRVQGQRLD